MFHRPVPRPVSPLRRRMIEDMAMRGLREETQRDYLRVVSGFAGFDGVALRLISL
jgi:integrase/recombinase XerD